MMLAPFARNRRFCGFAVLIAVLSCALLLATVFCALSAPAAHAEESGYYKLEKTQVIQESQDYKNDVYTHTYSSSALVHTESDTGKWRDDNGKEHVHVAKFKATCSAPPEYVKAGEMCSFELDMTMTENSNPALHFGATSWVSLDGVHFPALKDGQPKDCAVEAVGDWGHGPNSVTHVSVGRTLPSGRSTLEIHFLGCGAKTVWTYKWYEGTPPVASTRTNATSTSTSSSSSSSSDGSPFENLPFIAALAVAVLAALFGLSKLLKGKPGGKPGKSENVTTARNEPEEQKPPKQYSMVYSKDFGDKLRPGGGTQQVRVRIEESLPNGMGFVPNRQMTSEIQARGVQNLGVADSYMAGNEKVVSIAALAGGATAGQPILELSYVGEGVSIVNRIRFELADEPQIVFVNPGMAAPYDVLGGDGASDKNRTTTELLMDDYIGSDVHFAATNFLSKPDELLITPADPGLSVTYERYAKPSRPDDFMFKLCVESTMVCESPYGRWPAESSIDIVAFNEDGERAEATVDVHLWPNGMFFDTHQIHNYRVWDDCVFVDTNDILLSPASSYNIEGAVLEVGVAYRNSEGTLVVDKPNEPGDGSYLRLNPVDDYRDAPLSPEDSRIWYLLTYEHRPVYNAGGRLELLDRLGTLTLTPLMPMVSSGQRECRGSVELVYEDGERHIAGAVTYCFAGIDAKMHDADLKTERERIFRLLAAYKLEDWTRVDAALSKYGLAAEREMQRLGTAEDQRQAAENGAKLVGSIAHIQSPRRLRFMRQMVYEAADLAIAHDKIEAEYEAKKFDVLYSAALTVRWADDIAFSAWWYALCGPTAGAYVEALMTPLKDWVVGFLDILGLCMFDDEAIVPTEDYFTWDSYYEKVFIPSIENEFFAVVTSAFATGGISLVANPVAWGCLGAAVCFFFWKNIDKNTKKDPVSGKTEFDLWGCLKAATKDISIFGIKAVFSIVLARYFSARAASRNAKPQMDPDVILDARAEQARQAKKAIEDSMNGFQKALNWVDEKSGDAMGKVIDTVDGIGDGFVNATERIGAGFGKRFELEHLLGGSDNMRFYEQPIGQNAMDEIWQAFYDATFQKVVGVARDYSPDGGGDMGSSFDSWMRSLGNVEVAAKGPDGEPLLGPDGKPRVTWVPYLTFVSMWVDWLFERCGLNVQIDFSGTLPDEPDYKQYDQLIEDFEKMGKGKNEARFLTDPRFYGGVAANDPGWSFGATTSEDNRSWGVYQRLR